MPSDICHAFSHKQMGGALIREGVFIRINMVTVHFSNYRAYIPVSQYIIEPWHDKTNKVTVRQAKTQISLDICPVWSESLLCSQWVAEDPSFLHADSEDSDQTGWMPRLIWVFAGRTLSLLVLSCRCSYCIGNESAIHSQISLKKLKNFNLIFYRKYFNYFYRKYFN